MKGLTLGWFESKKKRKSTVEKNYLKKMKPEHFPDLAKDINPQIQKTLQTLNRINPRNSMHGNVIKLLKTKNQEKMKVSKEKQWLAYRRTRTWISISHQKSWTPGRSRSMFLKCGEKRIVNPEFCIQQIFCFISEGY